MSPLFRAVEYTDCISAEDKTLSTNVLDKTLNNLMARLHSLSFGLVWFGLVGLGFIAYQLF